MKKAILILAMIILSAGMLAACAGDRTVKLNAGDAGKTINLKGGEVLLIKLEGNPTTGYNWVVTGVDEDILQQQGEPLFKADSLAIGSGGMITLSFKALAAGTTKLQLSYLRSWEKDVAPQETYDVTVVVK